jgi:hypothetical protein
MLICGATIGDNPELSIREIYQSHRQILGAPLGTGGIFGLYWISSLAAS